MLKLDPQGNVTSARILKSTGHKILDDAALITFRQWRFKPGYSEVNVPVNFELIPRVATGALPKRAVAIFAPKPDYPFEARARHWTGSGIVLLNVDVKSGQVISARMLQSIGHEVLDEAALNAFRKWRFQHGAAAPQIKIPIRYTFSY